MFGKMQPNYQSNEGPQMETQITAPYDNSTKMHRLIW